MQFSERSLFSYAVMSDDITARVKLREIKILSDDYYVLRRADFDFCRSDGAWQERAGFERHVGFHTLRHHACSAVYRQSKDLRLTQKFARHKSVVTTSIYTHPTDDELLRAVQGLVC